MMSSKNAVRLSYRWGLPAVAVAVFVPIVIRLPVVGWTGPMVLGAAIWAVLTGVSETMPIALPHGDAKTRLPGLFDFGALLCFGTVPAAIIAAGGRIVGGMLRRTRPALVAFDIAQAVLVIGIAGAVYFNQGGSAGGLTADAPILLRATMVAMIVFALADAGLEWWKARARRIEGDVYWPPVTIQEHLLKSAVALPFGVAFAWFEATSGPPAAASALVLLLMARGVERAAAPVDKQTGSESDSRIETVRMLMSAIDAFDPFTRGLSSRIARASVCVARHLGLSPKEVEEVEYAALLHDIGRTAIHLDILARPGRLSGEERAVLQTHPTVGYQIIRRLPYLAGAAEIVYAHHEQPDGRGYPRGLKAHEIPVGARIIMVVAAFDAMTCERPYRRGLQVPAAYEELRRHAGTQFFPDVVEAFIALHLAGELGREPDEAPDATILSTPGGAPQERAAA
ncbi:MAG: HD-GYP domain-containing protein [Candidatus Eisenbacteria bacterium]